MSILRSYASRCDLFEADLLTDRNARAIILFARLMLCILFRQLLNVIDNIVSDKVIAIIESAIERELQKVF